MDIERLATIRAALRACQALGEMHEETPATVTVGVELLAEVDRLKAENKRLSDLCAKTLAAWEHADALHDAETECDA